MTKKRNLWMRRTYTQHGVFLQVATYYQAPFFGISSQQGWKSLETASFTAHWSYNKFILMNLLRFPQSFCCSDREWCLWRNLIEQFLHYRAKNILLRLNSLLFLTGISNSQHSNSLSLWELSERGICSQIMIASTLEEFNELVRLRFLADSLHVSQEKEAIE